MWFYCREQATDDSSEVLGAALRLLVHELCAAQALYARAIAHFVYRTLKNYYFASSTQTEWVKGRHELCGKTCLKNCKSVLMFLEDYEMVLRKKKRDQTERYVRHDKHKNHMHANPGPGPGRGCCALQLGEELCVELGGGVYLPADFSSALIEMNRALYHCDSLSDESRRKQIFCTDQVLP
jgi:hypothetical protein